MTPVYGLAEAGLGVTFTDLDDLPQFHRIQPRRFVERGHGASWTRTPHRIGGQGPAQCGSGDLQRSGTAACPDGQVGRIWVKGPSITKGYWESPELTANMIHGEWLDTGDLGFFYEGELYIAGRAKDLIIIRGRNYAPQEMEELLLDVEGVRKGCTVAVSTMIEGEGEQLIILAEKDPRSKRPEEEVDRRDQPLHSDGPFAQAPGRRTAGAGNIAAYIFRQAAAVGSVAAISGGRTGAAGKGERAETVV